MERQADTGKAFEREITKPPPKMRNQGAAADGRRSASSRALAALGAAALARI
jgi:hypothetical protein